MKFISFIEKRQTDVIEKILRYCGLWIDPRDRGPPAMLLDDQSGLNLTGSAGAFVCAVIRSTEMIR